MLVMLLWVYIHTGQAWKIYLTTQVVLTTNTEKSLHLLLSETILSPLPLRTAEISSVGGVWIFSGTTHLV